MRDIVAVSARSWKADVGTDLVSSRDSRDFVHNVVERFGARDDVHLWIAYDGVTPVAYELHIVYRGRIYPIRADFDERYRRLSPGSVVEYAALKGMFEGDYADVYFSCAGDYRYLRHWTDERVQFCDIEVFSSSLKSYALFWFEYRVMPLVRVVRRWLRGTPA